MRQLEALYGWNFINVHYRLAGPMRDSPGTATFGRSCKLDVGELENGQIHLRYSAAQSVPVFDGFGVQKIMYGWKYFQITRGAGYTSTHAKRFGILPVSMLKVRNFWFLMNGCVY